MRNRRSLCLGLAAMMLSQLMTFLGSVPVSAGAFENEVYEDLAVDESGNIYVVGHTGSYGDSMWTGEDMVVCKYGPNGNVVWRKTWGNNNIYAPNDDKGFGIAIDENNIYLVGYTNGITQGGYDIIIWKYDLNGNQIIDEDEDQNPEWPIKTGGSNDDFGLDIAIDDDYIYIIGSSYSFNERGDSDIVIYKFDKYGTFNWRVVWDSNGILKQDFGMSIAAANSMLYIIGYSNGRTNNPIWGYDVLILGYSKGGNLLWTKWEAGGGNDYGYEITTDGSYAYAT